MCQCTLDLCTLPAVTCECWLLSRNSRPTHLWSQIPAQILVPTRPSTTSEGPWLNPDLVGKWSHSPAKALPFLTQAQSTPVKPIPFLPQAQTTTILILNLRVELKVEFLLKTESGYLRDAEVTLFTPANPEHSLRFNTHWSAPPVSSLARSRGPRKMSQSPVSRNSNIERRMDSPKSVVGVIKGVA